jgi:hypothetical protein
VSNFADDSIPPCLQLVIRLAQHRIAPVAQRSMAVILGEVEATLCFSFFPEA